MKIEQTTITPALASKLLERNTHNRLLSPRRVNALAQCLQEGQWYADASPYRLTDDGQLLDGQHRLAAIVQAGVAVEGIVITGVDERAQIVMDSGRSRTLTDYLRMQGEPNVSNAAAATRLLRNYRTGALAKGTWRDMYDSIPALWEFYKQNAEDIKEGVAAARDLRTHLSIIGSVAAVLHIILDEIDSADRREFWLQLCKRSIPVPSVLLLIRMMDNRDRRIASGSLEQRFQLALAIKTWNRFRAGDNSNTLLAFRSNEGFPTPR